MKFLAIIEATIREGIARKTILGMFIVSTVCIVIALLLFQMDSVQKGLLTPTQGKFHAGPGDPGTQIIGVSVLDTVWTGISMMLLLISVFIGVFVTAGFITSLMEKGSIDLLLSKPVSRWMYIVGRYCGAVLIIFAEVAYLIFGLWLVAGISLGTWSGTFFISAFLITLAFAGVYALVTFIGVMTRSSWFAIIIGLAVYIMASVIIPIGQFIDRLLNGAPTTGALTTIATAIHYLVPAQDIGRTTAKILLNQPASIAPILITAGLTAAYVGISCYAFSKKEF
jgi:ABC-type transport system involved in multi-copper enzyme maturation permease subunit